MIAYAAHFALLALFFTSATALMDPLFNAVGIYPGIRSVVIQSAIIALTIFILLRNRVPPQLGSELLRSAIVWLPWLAYLALRADFSDPYDSLYVAKIVIIQFLGVLCLTAAFLANPARFTRAALPVLVIIGGALAVKVAIDPDVFIYASYIERVTAEGANPIWVARTYALGAMALLLIRMKVGLLRTAGAVVLATAIIPTGSRGPIISLILVAAVMLAVVYWRRRGLALRILGLAVVVASMLILMGPKLDAAISAYLSRGTDVDMVTESGRLMLFRRAFIDFMAEPLFGVGVGQFGDASINLITLSGGGGYYPHNIFLEVLSTTGLVGLALFIPVFRFGSWVRNTSNPFLYLFALTLLFSLTSGDLTGNTGVFFFATAARLYDRAYGPEMAGRAWATPITKAYAAIPRRY